MSATPPTGPVIGVIAVLSILLNGVLCLVVLRKRSMLKKSYNIFIFTLSVTDTLTGMFMLASPNYVLGEENVPVPEGIAGQMFCRIIFRGYFFWVMSGFSIALVTCMAVERWFAIAKPNRYKTLFATRRTVHYIIGIFLACMCWQIKLVLESPMEVIDSTPTCVWRSLVFAEAISTGLSVTSSVLGLFLPLLFVMATYLHLRFVVRKQIQKLQNMSLRRQAELEMKLSRLGLIVWVFLSVCFVPSYISYILSKFGLVSIAQPSYHNGLIVLAMLNSCVNPIIYCSTSKFYRNEFLRLLTLCKRRIEATPAVPTSETQQESDPIPQY